MKTLLFLMAFCFSATSVADSRCILYNSQTGKVYFGNCYMGRLNAFDDDTYTWIYGSCIDGGAANAFHPKTGAWIYGSCHLP